MAVLTGLDADLNFIRNNREKVLPIITGVILYRQLNRLDQRKVLEQVQALGSSKFFGKIQMLVAQSIAKPMWNPWSLSDGELRQYFNTHKAVANFLSTWFITIDIKLEVGFMAAVIYALSKGQGAALIKEMASVHIAEETFKNLSLSLTAQQAGARAFFVAVILTTVLKGFNEADALAAKKELLRRNMLRIEDL
ncbi:hypothetical protein ACSVUS_000707 [Vibrio alginolyticus]|uniref:hypothetical protein n=1 Tax=Vibrio TaxID=662 RepID=UPI000B1CB799|nr:MULTISPECIES: hypothetical protein [Vibrio]MDW1968420.1 hypothetical protein [Vibrio sp. 945]MDW2257030.1 hypothetical protein [Vibrio sp. 1409]MCA2484338.1 hypothetical protein [Vibrio alginolyticus]MCA6718396.1 hypothetical protein [Vibrio alginolyticus]MCC9650038.1 hypothetical protein [Vibrio sp. MA64]